MTFKDIKVRIRVLFKVSLKFNVYITVDKHNTLNVVFFNCFFLNVVFRNWDIY